MGSFGKSLEGDKIKNTCYDKTSKALKKIL